MSMQVLLLGGTQEARDLSYMLAEAAIPATASLAGVTRKPKPYGLPTRIGGFGGPEGFRHFLTDQNITLIVDALHPFASQMRATAISASAALSIPIIHIERKAWHAEDPDRWTHFPDTPMAFSALPADAHAFLATGSGSAAHVRHIRARKTHLRLMEPPASALPDTTHLITARPPFTQASEHQLFRDLAISHLVTKNAGGAAGLPKLMAARALGLQVFMVDRPRWSSHGPRLDVPDRALDEIRAQVAASS